MAPPVIHKGWLIKRVASVEAISFASSFISFNLSEGRFLLNPSLFCLEAAANAEEAVELPFPDTNCDKISLWLRRYFTLSVEEVRIEKEIQIRRRKFERENSKNAFGVIKNNSPRFSLLYGWSVHHLRITLISTCALFLNKSLTVYQYY